MDSYELSQGEMSTYNFAGVTFKGADWLPLEYHKRNEMLLNYMSLSIAHRVRFTRHIRKNSGWLAL